MSGPKAEWQDLPAGFDIDHVVAEKLGWTIEMLQRPEYLMKSHDRYRLVKNSGFFEEFDYWSSVDPWEGVRVFELIPEFSTDLNAAFILLGTEPGLEWNLFSDFQGITCELGHWNNEPGRADQTEQWNDKTAALAIVKAWLRWQERTDHPAPELPKGTES